MFPKTKKELIENLYTSYYSASNRLFEIEEKLKRIEKQNKYIEDEISSLNALLKHTLYAEKTENADKLRNKNPELYDLILEIISLLN